MNLPTPKATNTPPAARRNPSRAVPAFMSASRAPVSVARAQQLVGKPGGHRVDRVVKRVDRDLLRPPEDGRGRHVQRRKRDLGAAPDGGTVRAGGLTRGESGRVEQTAEDAPACAVSPVGEIVE